MSKNKTVESAPVCVEDIIAKLAAVTAKQGAKIKNRNYEIIMNENCSVSLAPQAIKLVEALLIYAVTNETSKIDEITIANLVEQAAEEGKLVTRQKPYQIWAFYRKAIMDAGFLVEIK